MEERKKTLAQFYGRPLEEIEILSQLLKDERKPACLKKGYDPSIFRTMVDYTRYPQAIDLHNILINSQALIKEMSVLDFGCLVADYAIYFARLGAKASIYDTKEVLKFANFRFEREGLSARQFEFPTDYDALISGHDLVIFGEVLEHIENPLLPIESCIRQKVQYLFTTCYPFGDDEYFQMSGHLLSAQQLQPDCLRLLSQYFDAYPSRDKTIVWKRLEP